MSRYALSAMLSCVISISGISALGSCKSRSTQSSEKSLSVTREDLKLTEIKRCAGGGIAGGPGGDFFSLGQVNPVESSPKIRPNCIARIRDDGEEVWKLDLPPDVVIRGEKMAYVKSVDTLYVSFNTSGFIAPEPPGTSFEDIDWLLAIDGKNGVKRWEKSIRKCSGKTQTPSSYTCKVSRIDPKYDLLASEEGVVIGESVGYTVPGNDIDPWSWVIGVSLDAIGFDHSGNQQFKVSDKIDFLTNMGLAFGSIEVDWFRKNITLVGTRCPINPGQFKCNGGSESFIDQLSFSGDRIWRFRDSDRPYPNGLFGRRFFKPDSIGYLALGVGSVKGTGSIIVGRDGVKKASNPGLWVMPFPDAPNMYLMDERQIRFEDGSYGLLFGFGFNLFGLTLDKDLSTVTGRMKTELYNEGGETLFNRDFFVVPSAPGDSEEKDTFFIFSPYIGLQKADKGPKTVYFERITVSGKNLALRKREKVVNTQPSKWLGWAESAYHFVAQTENGDVIQHGRYLAGPHREAFGFIRWRK